MLKNLYDLDVLKNDNYRNLDEDTVEKIKASILAVGLQEPIQLFQVNETGELYVVSGHHRLEAMKRIKAEGHEDMVFQAELVRGSMLEYRSQNVAIKSVMANSMRKDMAIIDRAKAYRRLEDAGLDDETIGKMVDKDPSTIKKTLMVADLPTEVLEYIEAQPKIRDSLVYKYAGKYAKNPSLNVIEAIEAEMNQKKQRKGASAANIKVNREKFNQDLNATGKFSPEQIQIILNCLKR